MSATLICMRTTLNLDDELVTEAKILALRRKVTLSAFIDEALRQALQGRRGTSDREFVLPSADGGGFPEGFPLHSGSSMAAFVEEKDD